MSAIVAVYADGGVIERNPSPLGGTWAWCHVDAVGARLAHGSGVLAVPGTTNNVSEFAAAVLALEALPDGWAGQLCSDSQITLGRLCWGWTLTGLPLDWVHRGSVVLARLGTLTPVLLQGHPTAADLRRGTGAKRGYPVSVHNVWCDAACQREAVAYRSRLALQGVR
jgi:ribonuclease HI